MMKVTVCRKEHFNAAHRLHNPNWDEAKNKRVFGSCNNENYHGHNYDLIVKLTGEPDPESGYVMDMKELKQIIREHIVQRFDHKNLYLDVDEFRDLNPTTENFAVIIWRILRGQIDAKYELNVVLYETERNYVEYGGR
jgi:6-pyruvoyltetrahydropterin/6-carboxytetrahydropterin synthase